MATAAEGRASRSSALLWLALRSHLVCTPLKHLHFYSVYLLIFYLVVFSTLIMTALAHLCSNSHLRVTLPSPSQDLGCFHWICQLKKNVSVKSADYRLIN